MIEISNDIIYKHQNAINFESADKSYEELIRALEKYGAFLTPREFDEGQEKELVEYYCNRTYIMRKAVEYIEQESKAIVVCNAIKNNSSIETINNAWEENKNIGHTIVKCFMALPEEDQDYIIKFMSSKIIQNKDSISNNEVKNPGQKVFEFVDLIKTMGLIDDSEIVEIYESLLEEANHNYQKSDVTASSKKHFDTEDLDVTLNGKTKKFPNRVFYTKNDGISMISSNTTEPTLKKILKKIEKKQPIVVSSRYPGQRVVEGNVELILEYAKLLRIIRNNKYSQEIEQTQGPTQER